MRAIKYKCGDSFPAFLSSFYKPEEHLCITQGNPDHMIFENMKNWATYNFNVGPFTGGRMVNILFSKKEIFYTTI